MTTITAQQMLKHSCGLCGAGRHDACPGAVWNPGSGEVITPAAGSIPAVHAGELRYCPCTSTEHKGDRLVRCRECGARNPLEATTDTGICTDVEGCQGRAVARRASDPTYQMVRECQSTVLVGGGVTERPRRANAIERAATRQAKQAAVARDCTCGCGGTTKGGAFLPGHDARHVSKIAKLVGSGELSRKEAGVLLAGFPMLKAKLDRKLGS